MAETKKKPITEAVAPKKPTAKKKTTAKKKASSKKKVVAKKEVIEETPIVTAITYLEEVVHVPERFTLVHVGEIYLATVFFSLLLLGVTYWGVGMSDTFGLTNIFSHSSGSLADKITGLISLR